MKKIFIFATLVLAAFCSCTDTEYETITEKDEAMFAINRAALTRMDTGEEIAVVGHKSQDPDAVCSAIAMAGLMQQLGMQAKPYMQDNAVRGVKYILQYTGVTTPEVKTSIDAGKPLLLTDHNDYLQSMDGAKYANVVGIVDHHGISDSFSSSAPIFCKFMSVGSTNTIVYSLYKECGVTPTKEMAQIMAAGILADTDSLTATKGTASDSVALSQLYKLGEIDNPSELWQGILAAQSSYDGMTDEEIFMSDTKLYEISGYRIVVASIDANESIPLEEMCQRMRSVMPLLPAKLEADMVFAKIEEKTVSGEGADAVATYLTHIPYCGERAKEAAEAAFGPTVHDNCIVVNRKVNRKSDFIPNITAALQAMPK